MDRIHFKSGRQSMLKSHSHLPSTYVIFQRHVSYRFDEIVIYDTRALSGTFSLYEVAIRARANGEAEAIHEATRRGGETGGSGWYWNFTQGKSSTQLYHTIFFIATQSYVR